MRDNIGQSHADVASVNNSPRSENQTYDIVTSLIKETQTMRDKRRHTVGISRSSGTRQVYVYLLE